MIRNLQIPPSEKLMLHTLNSRADRTGRCFPSIDQLVIDSCLARSTVQLMLKNLRLRGLIITERTGQRRHRNAYFMNLQEGVSLAPVLSKFADPNHESGHRSSEESGRRSPTIPIGELLSEVLNIPGVTVASRSPNVSTSPATGNEESFKIKDGEEEFAIEFWKRSDTDVGKIWGSVLHNLASKLPRQSVLTWFGRATPVSFKDGILTVIMSKHQRDWIRGHYGNELPDFVNIVEPSTVENAN